MSTSKTYQLSLQGNNIFATIYGLASDRVGQNYYDDVVDAVKKLNASEFGLLLDLRKFGGATPDAHEYSEKINRMLLQKSMVAKAVVVRQDVLMKIHQSMHKEDPELSAITQVFRDMQSASEWLLKQPHNYPELVNRFICIINLPGQYRHIYSSKE